MFLLQLNVPQVSTGSFFCEPCVALLSGVDACGTRVRECIPIHIELLKRETQFPPTRTRKICVLCVCALVWIITLEKSLCIKTKVSTTWYILSTRLLVCRLLSCNSVIFCDCMSPRCTYTCRCWVHFFFRLYFLFISPEINFTCVTKTNFFFNSSLQQVATREKHCAFFFSLHSSFSTMRFIFNVPASHIFFLRYAVLCDFGYVMSCANMIRKKNHFIHLVYLGLSLINWWNRRDQP